MIERLSSRLTGVGASALSRKVLPCRRRVSRMSVAVLTAAVSLGGVAHGQIIDRVMAVVNGAVITQSDVEAVVRFGLTSRPAAGTPDLVERLIDRRLTMVEVNRYSPPEPAAALVESRLSDVRLRFESRQAFERALEEVGISEEQLRGYLRDDLRMQVYLRQRFGAAYQPAESDILQYYRTHPSEFTRNGVLLNYGEAYDDARAALIVARREQQVQDWLSGLRRRADIIVPAGARAGGGL
ncbi:MAG: hypothetical protein H0T05_05415 [Acidobacteria bacterium]|nr:hypothetical protein [Acidobacteriota bacterium]